MKIRSRSWDGHSFTIHEEVSSVPEQFFTQIKDKKGRDIFEGDIVRAYSGTKWYAVGVVEYKDCAFWPVHGMREQGVTFLVIGNVYENPELIPKEEE